MRVDEKKLKYFTAGAEPAPLLARADRACFDTDRFRPIVVAVPLRYLTIDFNSFFASVEQQERPELRGKPVGIVPVMAETTGCVAISLEAKAAGLQRNARVAEARLACPGIIIVEARPEVYI